MIREDRQRLREAALAVRLRDDGASSPLTRWPTKDEWVLQTSNSFRRIGARYDGDVLCGTKHPVDGHPDLSAAPGVLEYVVAAQPQKVLSVLDALDSAEADLNSLRHKIVGGALAEFEQFCVAEIDRIAAWLEAEAEAEGMLMVQARLRDVASTLRAEASARRKV